MLRATTQDQSIIFRLCRSNTTVRFSANVSPIASGTKSGGLPNSEERTRTKAAPVGVTSSPVALHFIASRVSTAGRGATKRVSTKYHKDIRSKSDVRASAALTKTSRSVFACGF